MPGLFYGYFFHYRKYTSAGEIQKNRRKQIIRKEIRNDNKFLFLLKHLKTLPTP